MFSVQSWGFSKASRTQSAIFILYIVTSVLDLLILLRVIYITAIGVVTSPSLRTNHGQRTFQESQQVYNEETKTPRGISRREVYEEKRSGHLIDWERSLKRHVYISAQFCAGCSVPTLQRRYQDMAEASISVCLTELKYHWHIWRQTETFKDRNCIILRGPRDLP